MLQNSNITGHFFALERTPINFLYIIFHCAKYHKLLETVHVSIQKTSLSVITKDHKGRKMMSRYSKDFVIDIVFVMKLLAQSKLSSKQTPFRQNNPHIRGTLVKTRAVFRISWLDVRVQ